MNNINLNNFNQVNLKTTSKLQDLKGSNRSALSLNRNNIKDTISFKSNRENNIPKSKEAGKNVFPAVASLLIVGAGQFLNGENVKGAAMLGGALATGAVLFATGLGGFIPLVGIGMGVWSSVDAYRYNGKK